MSSKTKRKGVIDPGGGKGFALVTAILAIMILMALGFLAISVTTGDLKITARVVGEKKALIRCRNRHPPPHADFQPG